nr:sodium:proton antiporter [Phaeovulum vinaykumarii]
MMAFALVGVLGVGAQWLAWRLKLPGIVLMLAAGLLAGPVSGLVVPARDFGALTGAMISLAVAVILFEGGLALDVHKLGDARRGVARLVAIGAPLGWAASTVVLHWGAGLSWEAAAVFGGIMIVTGPTVIAPLLRQARLPRRPAQLLQWEAIVNDPLGALAAVLAFEVVLVTRSGLPAAEALGQMALGIALAAGLGFGAGRAIAGAFRAARVPDYMKVPVLVVTLLAVFALCEAVLHESGLLAVTVMGVVIANAGLPSFEDLRRFKEQATILLVSGVFILLAASMDFGQIARLDWRAGLFVAAVVLVARPLTVMVSLIGSGLPGRERALIAFTGPRGVVLVAVAGLFGERLAEAGVEDGALIGPLAFVLVLATVVLHGFTLAPMARALGLAQKGRPGLIVVGGGRFTTALAEALAREKVPVLVADPNHAHLIRPRAAGLRIHWGDILSEEAETTLERAEFGRLLAASDNDAYNTLVATDLAAEFGRDAIWQVARAREDRASHALPPQLGGQAFAGRRRIEELDAALAEGAEIRALPPGAPLPDGAWPLAAITPRDLRLLADLPEEGAPQPEDTTLLALCPPAKAA